MSLIDQLQAINGEAVRLMRVAEDERRAAEALPYISSRPAGMAKLTQGKDMLLGALQTLHTVVAMKRGDPLPDPNTNEQTTKISHDELVLATENTDNDLYSCIALTLNNLACIYRRADKEVDALKCLEETSEIESRFHGRPSCATLLNKCTVLIALGRADEAIPVAKQCVVIATAERQERLNHHTEQLTVALHNLSTAQQHCSIPAERRQAPITMQSALAEARRSLGDQHPTTDRIRQKLKIPPFQPQEKHSPESNEEVPAPRPPSAPRGQNVRTASRSGSSARPKETALRALQAAETINPEALQTAVQGTHYLRGQRGHSPSPAVPVTSSAKTEGAGAIGENPPLSVSEDASISKPTSRTRSPATTSPRTSPRTDALTHHHQPMGRLQKATDAVMPAQVTQAPRQRLPKGAAAHMLYNTSRTSKLPPSTQTRAPMTVAALMAEEAATEESRAIAVGARSNSVTVPTSQPSFIRFIPMSQLRDAPMPTTFADVRSELAAERRRQEEIRKVRHRTNAIINKLGNKGNSSNKGADASASPPMDAEDSAKEGSTSPSQAIPPPTVAVAPSARRPSIQKWNAFASGRQQRIQEEAEEEQRLRTQRSKIDEQLKREAERRHKLSKLQEARRVRATILIQRFWRQWWRRVGLQRRVNDRRNPNGIQRVFPALIRCAQKWLERSAGRRFLVRLKSAGATTADFIIFSAKVTKIQCAFRSFRAKRIAHERRITLQNIYETRKTLEQRSAAATVIQTAVRKYHSRRRMQVHRTQHLIAFALMAQAVGRGYLARRAVQHAKISAHKSRLRGAINMQRVWRGYQGRVRAAMTKIRRQYAIEGDASAGHEDRTLRSYAAMERRMAARKAEMENTDDTVPAPTIGSAMLDYAKNIDPSPSLEEYKILKAKRVAMRGDAKGLEIQSTSPNDIGPKVSNTKERYTAAAAERAADVTARYNSERAAAKADADTIAAIRMEAELLGRFHAPTRTAAVRIRAEEATQRELEKRTLNEWRAAVVIQRMVRRWLKKLRTDETVRYNLQYRKGEAQKRLYAKKEAAVKEQLQRASNRTEIVDLAAPVRATKEYLAAELADLEGQVRHRVPLNEVRSVSTRAKDAQVVKLMETQLAEREKNEAAELRTLNIGKFLTAKERLRLQKEEQEKAEEFATYQTVRQIDAARR